MNSNHFDVRYAIRVDPTDGSWRRWLQHNGRHDSDLGSWETRALFDNKTKALAQLWSLRANGLKAKLVRVKRLYRVEKSEAAA